uniref:ATP synthase complex subunit 8 n=1 Tax=Janus sp. TaxID=3003420 RepID=A0A9E8YXF8_9HYME|nr:ATP synthase F0 subunit 8 [Janus sp.]
MPQMSPMNWLFLMVLFTLLLIMTISLIYFNYMPPTKKNLKKIINSPYYSWKW